MNYATKIKTAMASALCVMVGMAFAATTVTRDVQTYGATFESTANGVTNDYGYANGAKIANYTNELGTAGWFAGSDDDESIVTNLANEAHGQVLLLNTDAETLTNKLSTADAAAVNAAMTVGGVHADASYNEGDAIGTYEGAVFESDVKFVASDTLDAGIPGGQDATKFAIYAYCDEEAETVKTNLVVFHKYYDPNDSSLESSGYFGYTNEVFTSVDIDVTDYTHLRIEMKKYGIEVEGVTTYYNAFSVSVGGGAPLDSGTAIEAALSEEVNSGIWFFTSELDSAATRDVSSLNFKGTGEIDNIKVSQKVKETYAAIVSGTKYASWETATNVAMNTANVLTSYESGKTLFLQAEDFISIANVQPVATNTVAGYKVETIAGDGFLTYTSKLDKATVIFLSDTGVELFRDDFQIGEAAVYGGTLPSKTADASGVYTWTGWTSGGVDYGTSDALATVGVGGATYTATFSSVASQASVNGTYYATLADAISAATGTEYPVVLNDDVALSSTIIITDDVTIGLNGHDIAATGCRAIWVKSGNVLITGEGNVTAEGPGLGATSSVIRVGDGAANANIAALTVNTNVTVASATCYGVTVFGKNNDGNNATTDITFDLYGTVKVSAPYVAHGCDAAISGNGNSGNSAVDITIHDGAVVTSDNANGIYFPSAGTLAIEGGTITGATAVYAKAGNIDISGGTLVATGTKAAYAATGDGANPTGDAIVIDNCGYPSGLSLDVAVTGGDVSSASGNPIGSFATGSGLKPKDGFVSGGTFNAPLADDLCADGFIPVTEPNGEGKYEVTPGGTVTFKNGDVVLFTTNVVNGGTAVYEGDAPTKAADASGLYTWAGWNDGTNDYATDAALAVMNSADQTYTATFSKSGDAKATVISVAGTVTNYYPTLAAAIAAAGNGDTVKLLANDAVTACITIPAGKAITIDLNGNTVTATTSGTLFTNNGSLTLKNGTITSTGDFVDNYGVLTIESGTYTTESWGIANFSGAETYIRGGSITAVEQTMCCFRDNSIFEMTGGTLASTCNAVIATHGTAGRSNNVVRVLGGTINASMNEAGAAEGYTACGIYVANDDKVTVSNVTINVTDGAGIVARAGSVEILDGTVINTTGTNIGRVGDSRVVVPAAAVVFDSAANYPGNSGETAMVEISGGILQSDVTTVQVVADEGDAPAVTIPTDSTALFSDADAEGVPTGYRLVADGETGLYKIEAIVPYLELMTDTMYINCTNFARVVDAPAGSTYRFKLTPDSVAGYNRSSNWDMAKPYGKAPGTATLTYYVTNNNEQVALFSTNITVKDVYAVVDGVEYSSAQWDDAVAAALANDSVLEIYKAKAAVALAAGQSLRWKYIGTKSNGSGSSVTCTVPAATSSAVYAVTETTDPSTGVTTSTCTSSAPSVMITKADGSVTYAADFDFTAANSTNKVLKSFSSVRQTVNVLNATLDLNGYTVTFAETGYAALQVGSSKWSTGSLTIKDTSVAGTGKIVNSDNGVDVIHNSSSVTIEGGAFEVVGNAVYLINANASATISGGSFKVTSGEASSLLNMLDSARGTITVTGGSFYGFDPANNTAEGAGTDFVAEGFISVADDPSAGWYSVHPAATVIWVVDGAATTNTVAIGTATASIKPANPAKEGYVFSGWTPAIAETVTEDATYTAQFDAVKATVFTIADAGATTNVIGTYASLQAALDAAKAANVAEPIISLLENDTITLSRNGNVLGGDAATKITINGNNHELHVVRDGTWAQFNTANDATLVLNDVSLTSEFTGTQTGWVGDTLQNPNHNIAFNCDVELNDVTSTTALSFWKDADLDTVTIAETVDVYSIWIHTTASNIAIKDLVVNSPTGRGIKVDDSFVKYAGAPSASTAISINGASFTTKNKKSAVLVRSAYPIAVTTSGTIDISNVPADTQHLVWVDVDASENFGLVTFNGAQSGLGVEGGASSYAASLSTNGTWIAGYYKVLADAVAIADADDTLTLQKDVTETFTVAKELTITLNGFTAENVTAGEGYTRTVTETTYVFAEAATGFNVGDENVGDFADPLTAEQAAWLNRYLGEGEGLYSKEQLAAATDLEKKYLLNVNPITGNGSLTVTGITVGGQVKVTVTLARTEGGTAVGTREINGVLELWGTTGLGSSTPFAKLVAATISDADFSEGNTQEITFEGSAKFFKAYIVEPPVAVEP